MARRIFWALAGCGLFGVAGLSRGNMQPFLWPDGRRAALSLTFDDARRTQTLHGLPLLDRYGVKATFFVLPAEVEKQREGWKRAVAAGHEIGNHTVHHPCSANFPWSRQYALEQYTLERMRAELEEGNRRIQDLLGVTPTTFAYPCGQKFVGRGRETRSYVPLVAETFLAGRGWMDEAPNDPRHCDLAQLTGVEMDGKTFKQLAPLLKRAVESGGWLILGGHEIAANGEQTTRLSTLERIIKHAQDPRNGIWLAPMGTVAQYIQQRAAAPKPDGNGRGIAL